MKWVSASKAFSLIELLIVLSMISVSFIFFTKLVLQKDYSNKPLTIPICDTLKKQCVYHLPPKSLPLINAQ